MQTRWFGVGGSTASDSAKAGAEAAATALAGREAAVLFVFCASSHDLPALLAGVRAEAGPDVAVVGGTTLGEMFTGGPTLGGVTVAALGGDGFTVRTAVAELGVDQHRAAGAAVAGTMDGMDRPHSVFMLLCDGLCADPAEVVRGAYSVLGATVPLVGGFTGDHRFTRTFQMHGDEIRTNTVIGIAIGSDAPLGIGIAHGWHRNEPAMVVTRSVGGRVLEMDDRPALDVLLRRRGVAGPAALLFDGVNTQSIGLQRRNGEDIRVIHSADDKDRSLLSAQEVPQGALCWLMDGDHESLITAAGDSCRDALGRLDGAKPLGVLAFDCGGRRNALGEDGVVQEVAVMREALGDDVPLAGFYTMGEIARVRGSSGTHALTVVTLAIA